MARKSARALNLNSVVIDAYLYVGLMTVIAMQNRVSDDLVQRFIRVTNLLEPRFTNPLDALYDVFSCRDRLDNKVIEWPLNCEGIRGERFPINALFARRISKYLYCGSLWDGSLRLV